MRVCIRRSDKRIIESQSGGGAADYDLDELTQHAIAHAETSRAAQQKASEAAALPAANEGVETVPGELSDIDPIAIRQQVAEEIKQRVAANLDVLLQNAGAAGLARDDVFVKEMDDAEYAKAMAKQNAADNPPPSKQERLSHMLDRHGLTLGDLKAALAKP